MSPSFGAITPSPTANVRHSRLPLIRSAARGRRKSGEYVRIRRRADAVRGLRGTLHFEATSFRPVLIYLSSVSISPARGLTPLFIFPRFLLWVDPLFSFTIEVIHEHEVSTTEYPLSRLTILTLSLALCTQTAPLAIHGGPPTTFLRTPPPMSINTRPLAARSTRAS